MRGKSPERRKADAEDCGMMPSFPKKDDLIQAIEGLRDRVGDELVDHLQMMVADACDESWDTAWAACEKDYGNV